MNATSQILAATSECILQQCVHTRQGNVLVLTSATGSRRVLVPVRKIASSGRGIVSAGHAFRRQVAPVSSTDHSDGVVIIRPRSPLFPLSISLSQSSVSLTCAGTSPAYHVVAPPCRPMTTQWSLLYHSTYRKAHRPQHALRVDARSPPSSPSVRTSVPVVINR